MTGRIASGSLFLEDFSRQGLSVHSLLIEKGGQLLLEAYAEPWERDSLHRLYSVTKSVVSLAIGKLIGMGKLSLSDRIASYFPELLPDPLPPELDKLKIEDMLKMETCHSVTTYKQGVNPRYIPSWKRNWLWTFFNTKPDHEPGTIFQYDTSSTHLLATLVERLSGKDFVSFVREGICPLDERTYITKDPEGHPCGGSGLMMTSPDLLRLGRIVLESDDWYVRRAVSRLVETVTAPPVPDRDLECGYGYQFWRLSHNAYCMYGMGGQFLIMVPDEDAVIVTTANTMGEKDGSGKLLKLLWQLLDEVKEPISGTIRPLLSEGAPIERNDSVTYSFPENRTAISSMTFDFGKRRLSVTADGIDYVFAYGFGKREESPFPAERIDSAWTSASLLPDGTLSFVSELIGEELGLIKLKARLYEDSVTIHTELFGEVRFRGFNGIATGQRA